MAQYVLDSAGFHIMAAVLKDTKKIDPAYLESVRRAKKVLSNAQLPAELKDQNQAFTGLLDQFAAALEAGKADEAADLANKVHAAQHAYTKAIDGWLSKALAQTQ